MSYFGRASINEVRYQNKNDYFVELKLLDSAIAAAEYQNWRLRICAGTGTEACWSTNVGSASLDRRPYFVFMQEDVGDRINLSAGMEIRLEDAVGGTIDYFRIGSYSNVGNGNCTPPFDWQLAGNNNLKNPYRDPDGTGKWSVPPGNSDGESMGETNPPGGGSTVPSLLLSGTDVTTTRGTPAVFTLSLSATTTTPVTIYYETAPSTAVAGVDYEHTSGSTTIEANASSTTVSVPTLATSAADGLQFYLVVTGVTGARVEDHFHAATILAPIPAIHHIELIHNSDALTCAAEHVEILVCADDSVPCTPYPGSVNVTLLPGDKWIGGNTRTVTAGAGSAELRHPAGGPLSLALGGPNPPPLKCRTGGRSGSLSDCEIEFHLAGFVFDVPTQTACEASPQVTISAQRMDPVTQLCGPAFSGTRTLRFSSRYDSPGSGTRPLELMAGGTTIDLPTGGAGTPVDLSFDGNGQASFAVRYADAGRLRLTASHSGEIDGVPLEMQGIDDFVVRPHSFHLAASTDTGATLDHTVNAGVHWAAGRDFRLQLRGQCADGTLTPNYQPTAAQLWPEPQAPGQADGGAAGSLSLRGTSYAGSFAEHWQSIPAHDFIAGAVIEPGQTPAAADSYAAAAYSEVGTLLLHVRDADYLGTQIPPRTLQIGRFRPDHFRVARNNTPEFRHATSPWSCGFTYVGQPFGYALAPEIRVTAHNAAGDVTRNYGGAFWRLSSGLQDRAYSNTANALIIERSDDAVPAAAATLSGDDDYDGTGVFTIDGDQLRYRKDTTPLALFEAKVDLHIDATALRDDDGVCHEPAADGVCQGFTLADIGGTQLRYGRLLVGTAYGSEHRPARPALRAEYLGANGFVLNADDSCTTYDASTDIDLSTAVYAAPASVSAPLTAAHLAASGAGALIGGQRQAETSFALHAPGDASAGPGRIGTVTYRLTVPPYLQFAWDGPASPLSDPVARATFGIYSGSERVIFSREVY